MLKRVVHNYSGSIPWNIVLTLLLASSGPVRLLALHNQDGAHDPSTIVKCGDTYWVFATGDGIYSMYSKDLVRWTTGKRVFPQSDPSWITTYAGGFDGTYWAPDCIYMNGMYYLYYSCSSWGSRNSAIGVATTMSLNPDDEDYGWTDLGRVVNSSDFVNYNCIDPAIFRGDDGRVWMSFGSHWDGIRIVELDSVSGKVKSTTQYPVAGAPSGNKSEASYVIRHGSHYYLFFNRGQCCSGLNSTYYIQVGRSDSPTGPYTDKNGKNLYAGGGTTVMSTSGRFIGPGCLAYYAEGGAEYVTYHYYDGERYGSATLGIARISWDEDEWPVISRDWIEDGTYNILNAGNSRGWDISGTGTDQDPVVQNPFDNSEHQQWNFESQGNGLYRISPAGNDLVVRIEDCSTATGAFLNIGTKQSDECELWWVERTGNGHYVFTSPNGNKVVEVPDGSSDADVRLETNYYTEETYQQWTMRDASWPLSIRKPGTGQDGIELFPNPAASGTFTIRLPEVRTGGAWEVRIYSVDGSSMFEHEYDKKNAIRVDTGLGPGIYLVNLKCGSEHYYDKLIFQ